MTVIVQISKQEVTTLKIHNSSKTMNLPEFYFLDTFFLLSIPQQCQGLMTLQLLVKDTTVSFNSHGIYNLPMYRQVNGNNQQWMFRLGGGKCITRDQWQHKLKGKLKTGACANTSRGAKGTAFREKKVVLGGWSRVQGLKGLELRSREMLLRRSVFVLSIFILTLLQLLQKLLWLLYLKQARFLF